MEKMEKNGTLKLAYHWHRRLGVYLALPIVLVIITGIVLNHSSGLKLDQRFVSNALILGWYGMEPKSHPRILSMGDVKVSILENLLFVDGTLADDNFAGLVGAAVLDKSLFIAGEDRLLIYDLQKRSPIETIGREILPPGKIIAFSAADLLQLDTVSGSFAATVDSLKFQPADRPPLTRQKFSESVPSELHQAMLKVWRSRELSLWRILLDIHSGRFFGAVGKFIVDLTGVGLLVLVLTGLYTRRSR